MAESQPNKSENATESEEKNDEVDSSKSFTEALREKYCFDGDDYTFGSCQISFHGRAGTGGAKAELAHLRNVVLNNSNLTYAGLPSGGLVSLCPNVIDLDLSSNNLTSWREILPIFQQLPHLKFVNLARNQIQSDDAYLATIDKPLNNVENLVLNQTFINWKDVLKIVKRLPALKEIHVCNNDYEEFSEIDEEDLKNIECFRANNNNIQKWAEVWKLRHLPKLHSLILSGNPVKDIFFHHKCCDVDQVSGEEPMNGCEPESASNNICDNPAADPVDQDLVQRSSYSCDTSETSTDKSTENGSQKLTNDVENNISENCHNLSRDHLSNTEKESTNQMSSNTPTSNRDGVSLSPRDEIEKEFETMVTELLKVANKMADQKLTRIKQTTNRFRYNSLQSEDGDYDDVPKIIKPEILRKVMPQVTGQTSQEQSPGETTVQIAPQGTRQSPRDVSSEATAEMAQVKSPSETGQMASQMSQEQSPELAGQMAPQVTAQSPKEELPPAAEVTVRKSPEGAEQMPSKESDQMPPKASTKAADDEPDCRPFQSLHTLCLTETDVHHPDHLEALTKFPSLKSVRLRDVPLYKEHNDEDSWKLFLASLPNIEIFNGSEISVMDRENSERFYIRHYLDQEHKPKRIDELEKKHGKLTKVVDIDISGNYQEYATLQFYFNGKKSFTKRLCTKDSVDKLRAFVAKEIKTSKRNFRLFHFPCGPGHVYQEGEYPEKEKLVTNLPMSRFNMFDGDEIHVETSTNLGDMDVRVVICDNRWKSRVPKE